MKNNSFYNRFRRGAASLMIGVGLMGLAGCAIPLATVRIEKEESLSETYNPDRLLFSNRAKDIDYLGDRVVFSVDMGSIKNTNDEIFVANKDGSNQKRLTFNDDADFLPCWTKDGKIVYQFVGAENSHYYIMEADGSNRKEITEEFYVSNWKNALDRK